jgi:YVTN family beta-propeller protein
VAVNPVTGKVYVATQSDHSVWIIDGATDAVITTVSLGFSTPNDLAVDTVANLVYVAVSDNQFQFVIDGASDTSVRAILLDGYATGVAVLPGQGPVLYTQFNQSILKILRF